MANVYRTKLKNIYLATYGDAIRVDDTLFDWAAYDAAWLDLPSGLSISRMPPLDLGGWSGKGIARGIDTIQQWARERGLELADADEVDELYHAEGVLWIEPTIIPVNKANAHLMASREWCERHDSTMWAKLEAAGWSGQAAVNVCKEQVGDDEDTPLVMEFGDIIGWDEDPGPGVRYVQPRSKAHRGYAQIDYATGCRLRRRRARRPLADTVPEPKVLRRGDAGLDVESLQRQLNGVMGPPMLVVDGKFGAGTEAAVKSFQRLHGLTVDGVAGPLTMSALALRGGGVEAPQKRIVPAVRTPVSARGLSDALKLAHAAVTGAEPNANRLGIAWAQVWGETGAGYFSWNHNLGNIKCTPTWLECMRLKDEHEDWRTNQQSIYRSYTSHAVAAEDYWRLMLRRYSAALAHFDAGDPNAAAAAMAPAPGKPGYFEAPLAVYQRGLRLGWAEFKRLGLS